MTLRPVDAIFKCRNEALRTQTCAICKGEAKEFVDALSKREYAISGLCQTCQDRIFTEIEEELDEERPDTEDTSSSTDG